MVHKAHHIYFCFSLDVFLFVWAPKRKSVKKEKNFEEERRSEKRKNSKEENKQLSKEKTKSGEKEKEKIKSGKIIIHVKIKNFACFFNYLLFINITKVTWPTFFLFMVLFSCHEKHSGKRHFFCQVKIFHRNFLSRYFWKIFLAIFSKMINIFAALFALISSKQQFWAISVQSCCMFSSLMCYLLLKFAGYFKRFAQKYKLNAEIIM